MQQKKSKVFLFSILLLLPVFTVFSQQKTESEKWFNFYGFGRTNFVWDNMDLGRNELFVPANIPVGGERMPNFFIGSKQSRLGFDFHYPVGSDELFIKMEGDFLNDATDGTGIFRMRHALVKYKFILIGMEWSNFFDIDANPSTVDFEGPNNSTLSRTPQVRFSTYKSKNIFSLSLENPIEKVTIGGSIRALPERFPDVIASYRINGDFGFVKGAGLFREVRYESDAQRSLYGYGLTVLSALKVGDVDKLKFQAVIGTGIARYIQGAVNLNYDAIFNGTPEMETLVMRGSNVSYQHFWKPHMHSSLTGGWLEVEDNINLESADFKRGYYGSVNLFFDVLKDFTIGGETILGERVNVDGQKSTALRLQLNATYKFNHSTK